MLFGFIFSLEHRSERRERAAADEMTAIALSLERLHTFTDKYKEVAERERDISLPFIRYR